MRWSVAAVGLSVLGCAGPSPRRPQDPPPSSASAPRDDTKPVAPAASSSTPVVAPPSPEPAAPPKEVAIALPPDAACALRSEAWAGDVKLRAGGKVFASIGGARATVTLPRVTGPSHVAIDDAEIALAVVREGPIAFLAKPLALGGFVVPFPDASLEWEAAGPGRVAVSLDLGPTLAEPKSVREEIVCQALAPSPRDYDARAFALGGRNIPKPDTIEEALLYGVSLAASPGARPVARVSDGLLSYAPPIVLEKRGKARRVVIEALNYYAIGWVEPLPEVGALVVGGVGRIGHAGKAIRAFHSDWPPPCSHDLTLLGEIDGERAVLGRLKAGTSFEDAREPAPNAHVDRELVAIATRLAWLELAPGARLLVKKSELAGCWPDKPPAR